MTDGPGFSPLYALLAEIAPSGGRRGRRGPAHRLGGSIERGAGYGLFELSEFFVRPGHQSAGVGRALLERAFPLGQGHLLGRGFQLDPFVTYLMASRPVGQFDRYLGFTPPFVL
jgi:GNAT superfamily N-acetyltransferase